MEEVRSRNVSCFLPLGYKFFVKSHRCVFWNSFGACLPLQDSGMMNFLVQWVFQFSDPCSSFIIALNCDGWTLPRNHDYFLEPNASLCWMYFWMIPAKLKGLDNCGPS